MCRELFLSDRSVTNPSAATDMATYMRLSQEVYEGKFNGPFYYQPFYYAVFLPALKYLLGNGIWPVLIIQSFISALTVFFAGLSAAIIAGKRAGLATAFLLTFSLIMIIYCPYQLIETLQAFWVILILFCSLNALKRGGWMLWAITGILLSFAILTRGNLWFFFPGLLLASLWSGFSINNSKKYTGLNRLQNGFFRSTGILPAFIFVIMTILPQIPFAYKNSLIMGKFCGPSTATSAVLAIGNTPEAPAGGRNPGTGPGPMEYPETYSRWMADSDKVSVFQKIMQWTRNEPLAVLELQFRKLLLFWDSREIPNNIAVEYQRKKSPALRFFGFIPTGFIAAAAISCFLIFVFGLFRKNSNIFKQKNKTKLAFLFYFLLAYWFATAAFYILARFRVPSVPLFAVAGGIFIGEIMFKIRRHSWKKLVRQSLPAAVVSLFIVYYGYDIYRYGYESSIMRLVRPNGTVCDFRDEVMILDNGPFTFGLWTLEKLSSEMILTKTFSIESKEEFKSAEIILPLTWEKPGEIVAEINDKTVTLKADKPGLSENSIVLDYPMKNNSIEMKIKKSSSEVYFIVDRQRKYGRTFINNKILDAELVCKLFLERQ